ncbi:MAG: VWA domain-containing protein [Phycisphaerae bacterium]
MNRKRIGPVQKRRRAAVTVFMAISLTVLIGFAALAVDIGSLYAAQAELQRAADAAALAAAEELMIGNDQEAEQVAFSVADDYARRNLVMMHENGVNSDSDVELGKAVLNGNGRYEFQSTTANYDSVRVTLRRDSSSAGGPVNLSFAKLLGHESRALRARAAAVLVPRDIAVVIDLSGSMTWDSTSINWNRDDGGASNLRDIWAALNGPEPSRPYMPGAETETEYAGDTGPSVGAMTNWGSALIPGGYSASSDPGLLYIRKSYTQTASSITTYLTGVGYSSGERTIIMGGSLDGGNTTHWRGRCAVMLGLATWKSGRAGGLYPPGTPGTNGNTTIDSGELVWSSYPSYRTGWTWSNYIDFVQSNSWYNSSSNDNSVLRYRYGLKTYTDFLLINYPRFAQTNVLWATPELPLRPVKDAVQTLADTIQDQDSLDHLSLEIFAQTSRHEVNLTADLDNVPTQLYSRQAAHYDSTTCIGCGLSQAITELTSARARSNAKKMIILMSDGLPNVDETGTYVGDGAAGATSFALDKAQQCADLGWRIYTVSVGVNADRALMQEIAAIGGGIEFYAAGNPEEYTEQLQDIFRQLGGKRPVQLIE